VERILVLEKAKLRETVEGRNLLGNSRNQLRWTRKRNLRLMRD
jgi:hypothetical protein